MDYPTIKALLDKYWEGETSLQEEAQLQAYFQQAQTIDARLKADAAWFGYTQTQAAQQSQRSMPTFQQRPTIHRRLLAWAVAASIALAMGLGWWTSQHQPELPIVAVQQVPKDTYDDPRVAYEATKAALKRLSRGLKKGVKNTRQELKTMPKLNH